MVEYQNTNQAGIVFIEAMIKRLDEKHKNESKTKSV